MSRTSSEGKMKMVCSSSQDKKGVLMSPDTNSHLFGTTHYKINGSDWAENVGLYHGTSVRSGS